MSESSARPDDIPRLRVTTPADFVELVPYLVGFHPRDSLVLVALRGPRNEIGLTVRVDLPAVLGSTGALLSCLEHLAQAGAEAVMLLVYDEQATPAVPLPHADFVYALGSVLGQLDVGLRDALLVGAERWWSYLCDGECCPAEGWLIQTDPSPSPVLAAVTVAGMVAAPDRESVVRSLAPESLETRAAVADRCAALTAQRPRPPTWEQFEPVWEAALASQETGERRFEVEEAATLLTGLVELPIRDECCRWAAGERSVAATALLRQVARLAVPPWDAPPYALLGWFAWREGDGAVARMALERALVADPGYRFAALLLSMIDRGVDPRGWSDPPTSPVAETPAGRA